MGREAAARMMYNPQLETFLRVADAGSFNKAAERLYLSPPSVMKQVNALEKHLQLTLLERDSHGIRLTPAGQVIYRHARFLFDKKVEIPVPVGPDGIDETGARRNDPFHDDGFAAASGGDVAADGYAAAGTTGQQEGCRSEKWSYVFHSMVRG